MNILSELSPWGLLGLSILGLAAVCTFFFFWVTGEDAVLVKMRWDLLKTEYVLSELTGDPC